MQGIFAIILIAILHCSSFTAIVFAGDSTSFNPVPIAIDGQGTVPVGTIIAWSSAHNPEEMKKWLECNGQAVSQAKYPKLYAVVGGRTPNYYNQFLRGGPSSQVGQVVADTTRSHAHNIQAHSHTVSGSASSQKVTVGSQNITGTAAGQRYYDEGITWDQRYNYVTGGLDSQQYSHISSIAQYRTSDPSAVTGKTAGGTYTTGGGSISGWTNAVAQSSDATGGAETAPQHIRVRYLIRALP